MKKYYFVFLCLFLQALVASCSAVFTAGVSGQILEYDGLTGFANVTVYVYNSDDDRKRDYKGFLEGGNMDFNGNFIPSKDIYVPRAVTDSAGKFEISKIIWSTSRPMFGKTDDVHNVYLLFYKEGLSITPSDNADGLVLWPETCKIVSSSSNPSIVNLNLCCQSKPFQGISGYIRSQTTTGLGTQEDDLNEVKLYYLDATSKIDKGDGTYEWKWQSAYEQNKKSPNKTTEAAPYTPSGEIISHGNFTGLGRDAEFKFIFNTGDNLLSKEDGCVFFYIEYIKDNVHKYSDILKVYSSSFVQTCNLRSDRMASDPPSVDNIPNLPN